MLEDTPQDLTPISKLGEFGLIERLTRDFKIRDNAVLKGVGDDAAVYSVSATEVHVVTTDLLVEGVHFDLRYVPMQHLGYKAVAVNLSDVYAMNARPFGITVSVGLSNRFTVEAMEAFYEGVRAACKNYNVDLLGGDTSSSLTGMLISVTAIGRAAKDDVVYRSGAKIHDLICVSGDLGAAFAGLQLLEREKSVFLKNPDIQPDLSGFDYVVGRQLKPEPRADVMELLREAKIRPTSMIDISDGLGSDLLHLCRSSKTGATIYEDKLVIDPQVVLVAEQFGISPLAMALEGGEDYELLFTVPLEYFENLKARQEVHIIGHMVEEDAGVNIVTSAGSMIEINEKGWNHFKGKT